MRFCKAAVLLFCVCLSAHPLDIFVNGERDSSYSNRTYTTYRVPTSRIHGPGEVVLESTDVTEEELLTDGISLHDVLPLTTYCYRMIVVSVTGRHEWERDDLAEQFTNGYLIRSGDSWNLLFLGAVVREAEQIHLWAEPLIQNELEVWVSWEGVPLLKQEIRRFSDLHGVSVRVVEVPKILSKLTTVIRGRGTLPDVVMVQSDYVPTLIGARAVQRLSYWRFDGLLAKSVQAFEVEGEPWAVPFYFDAQMVFYNPEYVDEQIGPEWTLDDFERIAEQIRLKGVMPVTWNAYSAYWLAPFQIGFGKRSLVGHDGTILIEDAYTEAALEYILSLKHRELLHVLERDAMVTLFTAGRVGMILSGSYSIPEFERLGIPFRVASYPFNQEVGKHLSPFLDFKGFSIVRTSRNTVLARRMLEFLTGVGVQQRFMPAAAKLTVNSASWEVMKSSHPYYRYLAKSTEIGIPVPPVKSYNVYKNTMWKILRFAISEQMSVGDVLNMGQQAIDAKAGQ